MEAHRFSNDYAETQITKFKRGELSHNQVAELVTVLQQRIGDNHALARQVESHRTLMNELDNELDALMEALALDPNRVRGVTTPGTLGNITRKLKARSAGGVIPSQLASVTIQHTDGRQETWKVNKA